MIDLDSGTRIWSDTLQEGYMITNEPSPIIVKKDNSKHMVVRYDRQGRILSETAAKGMKNR